MGLVLISAELSFPESLSLNAEAGSDLLSQMKLKLLCKKHPQISYFYWPFIRLLLLYMVSFKTRNLESGVTLTSSFFMLFVH